MRAVSSARSRLCRFRVPVVAPPVPSESFPRCENNWSIHRRVAFRAFSSVPEIEIAVAKTHPALGDRPTPVHTGTSSTPRSPEQERVAQLEHERMVLTTKRLLAVDSLTPATMQEFVVAFQYWTGRRSTAAPVQNAEQQATSNAEALWEWVLEKDDLRNLQPLLATNDSPLGCLISLMERYLMPFRGTHQSLVVSRRRLRFQPQAKTFEEAMNKAAVLLQQVQRLLTDASYQWCVPDQFTCNMELTVWSKRCWFLATFQNQKMDTKFVQIGLGGAMTPQACLERMEEFLDTMRADESYPAPSSEAIMILLTAWVHSGLPQRVEQAERLLDSIRDEYDNCTPFNAVMYAHALLAEADPSHATRAALLMGEMKESEISMDIATYSTMLLALTNAGHVEKAESLLSQMESNADRVGFAPNSVCYNIVLDALAKSSVPGAPARAESLIQRMEKLHERGNIPDGPDIVSYSAVIDAWCRSSDPSAAKRAEQHLFDCEFKSEANPLLTPDVVTYNIILDMYSRRSAERTAALEQHSVDTTSVERAEQLLSHMRKGHNPSALPGTISYNCLLNAWANCGDHHQAAVRARETLKYMKDECAAGNVLVKPDLITYNVVLRLVARSPTKENSNEVIDLLQEISENGFHADTISYNSVMDSIIKSGEKGGALKVEEMLLDMEEQYRKGNANVRPTDHTYNIVINAHAQDGDADAAERILEGMIRLSAETNRSDVAPTIVSFGAVLNAYAQSGKAGAAETLVRKMEDMHNVSPNRVSFNSVMNALAKSRLRDAPQRAEAILNHMQQEYESGNEGVQPDSVSFSTVINCWARSSQRGSADRAEAILHRMEELNRRGQRHLRPNVVTYSAVLNALSKCGEPDAADRAVRLLDRMEESYRGGRAHSKPNSYCYNAAINVVAKGVDSDKATRARELLDRMHRAFESGNLDSQPNVLTYSSVLNACAYTRGSEQDRSTAFRIARGTLKELLSSNIGDPTVVTYLNFMTACARLLPPSDAREKIMIATYRESLRGEKANEKIENLLRANVRRPLFEKCMALQ